eukprot:jgi/Galph1/1025/GphlegSOOS_G5871.1
MELVSGPQLDNFPILAGPSNRVRFDPEIELLWSSTVGGQLASYRCADLSRYSSIQVCNPDVSIPSQQVLIRDFTINTHLVFVAAFNGLRCYTKGCLLRDELQNNSVLQSPMSCVALNPFHQVQVFCANDTGQGVLVDTERFKVIRQERMSSISDSSITCCCWTNKALITGDSKGKLSIREPTSFQEYLATCAFIGPIIDIDVQEQIIAVAGMSSFGGSHIMDTIVKLFDLRMLHPLQTLVSTAIPIQVQFDMFGRTCKGGQEPLWIRNSLGVLECFDVSTNPSVLLGSIIYDDSMTNCVTSFDISETGPIALADSFGMFHLWSCTMDEDFVWNFAAHVNPIYPKESTSYPTDDISSNNISFQRLAQDSRSWSLLMESSLTHETKALDSAQQSSQDWLSRILGTDYEHYADSFVRLNSYRKVDPRILEQIEKNGMAPYVLNSSLLQRKSNYGWIEYYSPEELSTQEEQETFQDSPAYRCVYTPIDLIALQSFEGFDYTIYNKSPFCGLENGLPNSYINPVIQSLFFIYPFREYVIPLDRIRVEEEYCLMDELSLLFQMMKVGSGQACEASNFMRAFQKIPNTSALGLLDGPTAPPVALRVESFYRYILEQLSRDDQSLTATKLERLTICSASQLNSNLSLVENLFGNAILETFRFIDSNAYSERTSRHFLFSLSYDSPSFENKNLQDDFCMRLESSLCEPSSMIRAYNENTKRFEYCAHSKYLIEPSNIFVIGCHLNDDHYWDYWYHYCGEENKTNSSIDDNFQDLRVRAATIAYNNAQDIPSELFFEKETLSSDTSVVNWHVYSEWPVDRNFEMRYELCFVIALVPSLSYKRTGRKEVDFLHHASSLDGHLVLYVRESADSVTDPKNGSHLSTWWCINDFCMSRCVSIEEVTRFHPHWKLPCILGYKAQNVCIPIPSDPIEEPSCIPFINKHAKYLPSTGSYVALDAEFVEISKQVSEIYGDGRWKVVKPSRMSLGRVSVVTRSREKQDFMVLMDDYIVQREPVIDYLSKYSGLKPGDLDVGTSTYALTTLKAVYIKLRCLVDNGCVLIGHGLKKDFRIINFIVPKHQVVDTVELYRLPRQRLLSLRFLAATLLQENIQVDKESS